MTEQDRWREYAASYALDALDAEEKSAFEAHLSGCAECQDEVRSYREVTGLLASGVSQVAPPEQLKQRILAEVAGVRPLAPARREGPQTRARRATWWAPALAASLVFAISALVLYAVERGRGAQLQGQLAMARDSAALLDARVAQLDSLVGARDSLLSALLSEDVRTVTLAAQGRPPSARLYWNRQRGVVVVAAFDLPPAASGRTYQLWGIATGQQPVSLGTFNTGADGRVATSLAVDPALQFDISAVTEEPAGGSPQPTTTPFLIASWSTP
jgi:anti-sigma-K factor RskA